MNTILKTLALIIGFIFSHTLSFSQETIQLQVVQQQDNKPLQNANIYIQLNNLPKFIFIGFTDENGIIKKRIPDGLTAYYIKSLGFKDTLIQDVGLNTIRLQQEDLQLNDFVLTGTRNNVKKLIETALVKGAEMFRLSPPAYHISLEESLQSFTNDSIFIHSDSGYFKELPYSAKKHKSSNFSADFWSIETSLNSSLKKSKSTQFKEEFSGMNNYDFVHAWNPNPLNSTSLLDGKRFLNQWKTERVVKDTSAIIYQFSQSRKSLTLTFSTDSVLTKMEVLEADTVSFSMPNKRSKIQKYGWASINSVREWNYNEGEYYLKSLIHSNYNLIWDNENQLHEFILSVTAKYKLIDEFPPETILKPITLKLPTYSKP